MSIVSSASSAPATSASVSGPGRAGEGEDGAVVVGVGVAVEQGDAAGEGRLQAAPGARASLPSETLGTASRGGIG